MRTAFAGLTEAAGSLVSIRRRWVAAIAGSVLAAAVISMTLGDVLIAYGKPQVAAALPGNAALASAAILPRLAGKPASGPSLALARQALANSPLAVEALVFLALDAKAKGDSLRARRLLEIAGMAGWRDEIAQRQLFNLAVSQGDGAGAMRHADALLRQGKARADLFVQFDRGLENARFRKAAIPYIIGHQGWPRDYLATHGAGLSDAALLDIAIARTRHGGGLEREVAAPLIGGLLASQRNAMAARIWTLVPGADGRAPGALPWPKPEEHLPATPFDWQMSPAYVPAGTDSNALAVTEAWASPASRLLALPPGHYRLSNPGSAEGLRNWNWGLACGIAGVQPARSLAVEAVFSVPDGCPVQRIAIAPRTEAADSGAVLDALRVERLP